MLSVALSLSGESVVADFDIVFFLVGPAGLICALVVGVLRLGFTAIELTAFLGIIAASEQRKKASFIGAIRFTLRHAVLILRLTTRGVLVLVTIASPFVVVAGLVFYFFVSKFDINYYLANRPFEWRIALTIWSILAAIYLYLVIRLLASWFFALPLLLFENESPRDVLKTSRNLAFGHRYRLIAWLVAVLIVFVLLNSITFQLVLWIGALVLRLVEDRLSLVIAAIGGTLTLWFVLTEVVNLTTKIGIASIIQQEYSQVASTNRQPLPPYLVAAASPSNVRHWYLGKTFFWVVLLTGATVSMIVGYSFIDSINVEDKTAIYAHRGASGSAPENTMAAIEAAIAQGADFLEIDVQELSDGQVVVFHDSDFMRQARVNLTIWDATPRDIEKIDIGTWFAPKFSDQRVPLLSDVLKLCKGKIKVDIELKYYGHSQMLEQRVIDLAESLQMESEIVIMSLDKTAVAKVKLLRPQWTVGLLTAVAIGDLTAVDADFLAVSANLVDQTFVEKAHASGKPVLVWTVNDPVTISKMISRGVDGIITDKPSVTRSVLAYRSELSAPERLVLEVAEYFGVSDKVLPQ